MGTANCGTSPLSMTFTRSVKADRRRDPVSAEPWATNERRWPGRRPSGPPEAPARKYKIAFLTSSSVATARTTDPSGGSGRLRFSGAEGCFSFKAQLPHSHHPRQIWPLLFSSESHPLHGPRPPLLVVTCTAGRSVPSINRTTCCLTSVESETCLTPPDSLGYPKPQ